MTVFSYSGRVKSPEWRWQRRRDDLRHFEIFRHGLVYTDPCTKALTECSPLDFRRSSIRRSPHTEGCLLWVRGQLSGTERRTRDLKVSDSSPSRIGGRIFFLRGQFSVLVPVSVAVPSHVTAVAHTRSRSLCQTQAG